MALWRRGREATDPKRDRAILRVSVFLYVSLLVLLIGALRLVGEAWWLTTLALYLPRWLWCTPLVVLGALSLWLGTRSLSFVLLGAAGLAFVGLLEFQLPTHGVAAWSPGQVRIMSYNANECRDGWDAMVARAVDSGADLVFMQEVCLNAQYVVDRLQQTFQVARLDGEFLLASRYPLSSVRLGQAAGEHAHARHVRYEIESPLGPLAVYHIHPTSPRPAWIALARRLQSGLSRLGTLHGELTTIVDDNTRLRARELALATESARRERLPVVIVGDTNLPGSSPLSARALAGFRDGFSERGRGFGYTYPGVLPFLRIDRVLTSATLCFASFRVGCRESRDHFCVLAGIEPCDQPVRP